MMKVTLTGNDLTIDKLWAIAADGAEVEISPEADAKLEASRQLVYDLVHAVKSAHIGTDALQTSLSRVSSGLKMVIKQSDGSAFIPEIASVKVNIGNIAEKINFYTGTAENMTKTVQFELSRSEDGLSYGNITVMLFPSAANPPLELIITLQDGTEYKLSENLNATLSPNTRLTLNINVGKILVDGNPGDFDYDDWNEESETIDFPIVD